MMGYWGGMMQNWGGFGTLATLLWMVLLVDLVLLGIWLWKKIQEK